MNTFTSDLHFHTTDSDGNKTNAERIEEILLLDPKRDGIWAATNHDRFSPGCAHGAGPVRAGLRIFLRAICQRRREKRWGILYPREHCQTTCRDD